MEVSEARFPAHSPLILDPAGPKPGISQKVSKACTGKVRTMHTKPWWEHSALLWEDTWQARFLSRGKWALRGELPDQTLKKSRIASQQPLPLLVKGHCEAQVHVWSQVAYFPWVLGVQLSPVTSTSQT